MDYTLSTTTTTTKKKKNQWITRILLLIFLKGASFVTNKRKCIDEMECALCNAGEEILEQQFIKYPITRRIMWVQCLNLHVQSG